jgi:hypothetical protein
MMKFTTAFVDFQDSPVMRDTRIREEVHKNCLSLMSVTQVSYGEDLEKIANKLAC